MIAKSMRFPASNRLRLVPFLALAMLSLDSAQAALVTCQGGVESLPILDPASTIAGVGNYTLECGGGGAGAPPIETNFQFFFNVLLSPASTPTLWDGTSQYSATAFGGNLIAFLGITFSPSAASFSLQNVFVDATTLPENQPIVALVSAFGSDPVVIDDPTQTVAINGSASPAQVPEPSGAFPLLAALTGFLLWSSRRGWRGSRRT